MFSYRWADRECDELCVRHTSILARSMPVLLHEDATDIISTSAMDWIETTLGSSPSLPKRLKQVAGFEMPCGM